MKKQDLLEKLKERHMTLSCMESLTGGMFASKFTSIPGASEVFKGGAITYTDEVKESFGVDLETVQEHGAVSMECAKEMAVKACDFFQSDCSVSFTGNAGPSGSEGKPVGLVYVGIRIVDIVKVFELHLNGDRQTIREKVVDFGFTKLLEELN